MSFFKSTHLVYILVIFACLPTFSEASNHSVSPLIIDLELEKRDIIHKEITVTNHSGKQLRVFPSVHTVAIDDDGAIEAFTEPSMVDDKASSITSWIQVPRKRIEILAGESVTIPVTIKIHPEVKPGEYHAVIGLGDGSNSPQAVKKVRAGTAPGTVIRISIDKVQNQFLRLEKFAVERFVTENDEGTISYILHNPGDDPVVPAGEIIFYNNSGGEIYSLPVNPDAMSIASGKTEKITDDVPDDFKIGKYKAFLSVEYGEHLTSSVHDTAFFYVLPLKQLILIFVIVLVVALLIALYVHRRYDVEDEVEVSESADVPMYLRTNRSESQDHDIDLSKKN